MCSPGRPADNGRVQGGKQGGPKNCAGAVDTDAGKQWGVRTRNEKNVQEQKIMKTKIFMLQSLASRTTCRLFRSRSQKRTDGSTRIGRNTAEGPCGGGRWRELSKKLTGTFHQKSFGGQFLWLFKEGVTSIPSHANSFASKRDISIKRRDGQGTGKTWKSNYLSFWTPSPFALNLWFLINKPENFDSLNLMKWLFK